MSGLNKEFLQTPPLSSSISLFIETTFTPPSSLSYHSSSSSRSPLIMEFAPAVCYNKGWREHMKGRAAQDRGESQGHRRGSLPSFSFCPPFLSLVFQFAFDSLFISHSSSHLLFFLLSLEHFPRWLSRLFSPSGCNMSADFSWKLLNFVSVILSLWQIFFFFKSITL